MTEAGRTQIKTAAGCVVARSWEEQSLYRPCKHILDSKLILKYSCSSFVLGAALLLWGGVTAARGEETRNPDQVLLDALPEKVVPQLQEILVKAMRNAPKVIDSGLNLEMAGTRVKMARAPMLPNASGSFNTGAIYERYQYPISNSSSTHLIQALTYNAGVSQPLYHWGALKKGYQSAQLQRAIAERNITEACRLLAIDIRRAYFNLIIAANARDAEQTTLANLEKERDFQKQQQADGFVTASIVSSAETSITNFKLQMRRSENSYQAQWTAFRQLTGIETLQASDPLPKEVPAIPVKLGDILKDLSDQFGDYRPVSLSNADDSVRSEQLNYEIVRTRLRPQLNASLSASQDNRSPDNNSLGQKQLVTSFNAFASVNWNIFDGFYTQALKQSSLISLRQLRNSRDQTEHDYRENLKSYVANLRFNWESLQTSEVNLAGYRSSVDIFQKDYEVGLAPKKAWDDAKIVADNGLQAAISARADYYMQIVNYLSLRGKDPVVNPVTLKQPLNAAKN